MNIMAKHNGEPDPFADYVWMGDMEQFDQEVEAEMEKEFEEEEFIRSCIEQLLEEEEERETVFFRSNQPTDDFGTNNPVNSNKFQEVPNSYQVMDQNMMQNMYITAIGGGAPLPPPHGYPPHQLITNGVPSFQQRFPSQKQDNHIKKSTLNPNAAPFSMNPNAKEFVPRFATPKTTATSINNVGPSETS